MSRFSQSHIQRIRSATTQKLGRRDLAKWIETNTYINGKNFSFAGHEYQKRILEEEAMKENTGAVHVQVPVDVATSCSTRSARTSRPSSCATRSPSC